MASPEKSTKSAIWTWLLVLIPMLIGGIVLLFALAYSGAFIRLENGPLEGTPTPTPSLQLSEPVIDTSAIVVSGNTVTIRWEPVEGADRYILSYGWYETSYNLGYTSRLKYTVDTHYTVQDLVAGVEYTFRVSAHGDASRYRSSSSAEVKVKVPSDDGTDEEGEEESHE